MTDKILVFSNCGSEDEALKIARALVEARLAACVNVIPGVRSVYRWQGAIEEAQEWTIVVKTTRDRLDRVESEIKQLHSYGLPEVLVVDVSAGSAEYLAWIDSSTAF